MNIADFDYHLPPERIAQTPLEPRDSSRLLVLHRDNGAIEHRVFRDIGDYLRPGDLLVANQSRVLPARLRGEKVASGGAVEVLLLAVRSDRGPNTWEALVRPGRRIHDGQSIVFGGGALTAEVLERAPSGGRLVRFTAPDGDVPAALMRLGSMPLPPYIHEPLADAERYQTVYARLPGSAAAPTAGLHFTPALLAALEAHGVGVAFVTLHIGLDTFRPIAEENLDQHAMHSEEIEMDAETAARINATRRAGGRIVAVGTTAVRTLEAVAGLVAEQRARGELVEDVLVMPYRGRTSLFIRPGFTFRAVDVMLTNFHLPRSTLVVLVSAFAGRERILAAYQEAVAHAYRFYSFGDAMLIL
ncbi:MAG TPA: tRNA preQ1(34) S-adenosylmethionine ribosyltransferase-isomerase QueA [Ktedonobacterales bacterium]|nr:tRNA preQ1(34) S-adenosylmethionine ribosyltransferase-isomerase QueA [Ktedonobacterales bacterium]